MFTDLKAFIQRWLVTTLAVAVAAHVVPGIGYQTWPGLLVAALLLGILNAFLRPILMILALPLLLVTLGLFTLVINALLLYFVGYLVNGFEVAGFASAFWGGLLISITSMMLNILFGNPDKPAESKQQRREKKIPGGGGPVIDV